MKNLDENNRHSFTRVCISEEHNRYISEALLLIQQMDLNSFVILFQRKYTNYFHMEDLEYWCDLFGIDFRTVLIRLKEQGLWMQITVNVYVRHYITSIEKLKYLCKFYRVEKGELFVNLFKTFEQSKGILFDVFKELPYTYPVLKDLLNNQDYLLPVTERHWLPAKKLAEPIQNLSRLLISTRSNLDELIILTFSKAGRPLRIEELIYKSTTLVTAPPQLKNLFLFMLKILPVYQVDNTCYWALCKWEVWLDIKVINTIYDLLLEIGSQSFAEIACMFPECDKEQLIKILEYWPEFIQNLDSTYGVRVVSVDEDVKKLIGPEIIKSLSSTNYGVSISELHQQVQPLLAAHGLSLQSYDFKEFIKSWGKAAIIGTKVYLMTKAPIERLRLSDVAYIVVKEYGSPMPFSELEKEIRIRRNITHSISSVLLVEPKLSRPTRGYWALKEWELPEYDPDIHNRIGEVLVSIIQETDRPVHKSELRRLLRRRGMKMNEVTLHMDLVENPLITQVGRGVYSLTAWNLTFRDLFNYNFPFKLSLPDGNPSIYELKNGVLIEYFVTKACLELGRILIKRYMIPYFEKLSQYLKYNVDDIDGDPYAGWVDHMEDGRYQLLGLRRWYKTHKSKYGENIYIFIPVGLTSSIRLLSSEQVETYYC